jgi:large subunit ribosomal protein L6
MSRVGKKPVAIPNGVKVSLQGNILNIEGPKGKLSMPIHYIVNVVIADDQIKVERKEESPFAQAMHGTTAALIRNMVEGVSKGYTVTLEVVGLGYKAAMKGQDLELNLGYSHPIYYKPPAGVKLEVKDNKITVSGIDKQLVGQVAAEIAKFRKPDPYKGKGIRYEGQVLKLKPGKSAGKGKK